MNALQQLIKDFRSDNPGENYSTIAVRGDLPYQTVQALAKRERPNQTPRAITLAKLAKGMRMPEATVRRAAASSAGYDGGPDEMPERLRRLWPLVEDLTDEQFGEVIRRARTMHRERLETINDVLDVGDSLSPDRLP